jgi:hypothetical protein
MRCYVEKRSGMRARFRCPEGHTFWRVLIPFWKRRHAAESSARMLAAIWSKEAGGVTMMCPECRRNARQDVENWASRIGIA